MIARGRNARPCFETTGSITRVTREKGIKYRERSTGNRPYVRLIMFDLAGAPARRGPAAAATDLINSAVINRQSRCSASANRCLISFAA